MSLEEDPFSEEEVDQEQVITKVLSPKELVEKYDGARMPGVRKPSYYWKVKGYPGFSIAVYSFFDISSMVIAGRRNRRLEDRQNNAYWHPNGTVHSKG